MAITGAYTRLQLVNYTVFDSSGKNLLGTSDIELPSLEFITAEISGSGISGKFDMPTLGEWSSAEFTLNWRSLNTDVTALSIQKVTDLLIYGAEELMNYGSGKLGVEQVKINFRGISKKTELGNFKPAELVESKNTFETLYLKLTIGNKAVMELDKINFKAVIDGTDYLAETRRALGMS